MTRKRSTPNGATTGGSSRKQEALAAATTTAPIGHAGSLAQALRDLVDEEHAQTIEALLASARFRRMSITDADETAEAMTSALRSAPDRWAQLLGPCFSLRGLAKRLTLSPQAVSKRAQRLQLLCVFDDAGRALFPAFALHDDLSPVRGLHETLERLHATGYASEPETWAWWLRTPHPDLAEQHPIEALRAGVEIDRVLAAVDRDASARRAA